MPPQNPAKRAKLMPLVKTHKIVAMSNTGGELRFVLQMIIPDFHAIRHDAFTIVSDDVTAYDLDLPQSRGSWYLTVSTQSAHDSGINVGLVRGTCPMGSFYVRVRSELSFGPNHVSTYGLEITGKNTYKSEPAETATTGWTHRVTFAELFGVSKSLTSHSLYVHLSVRLTPKDTSSLAVDTLASVYGEIAEGSKSSGADATLQSHVEMWH